MRDLGIWTAEVVVFDQLQRNTVTQDWCDGSLLTN